LFRFIRTSGTCHTAAALVGTTWRDDLWTVVQVLDLPFCNILTRAGSGFAIIPRTTCKRSGGCCTSYAGSVRTRYSRPFYDPGLTRFTQEPATHLYDPPAAFPACTTRSRSTPPFCSPTLLPILRISTVPRLLPRLFGCTVQFCFPVRTCLRCPVAAGHFTLRGLNYHLRLWCLPPYVRPSGDSFTTLPLPGLKRWYAPTPVATRFHVDVRMDGHCYQFLVQLVLPAANPTHIPPPRVSLPVLFRRFHTMRFDTCHLPLPPHHAAHRFVIRAAVRCLGRLPVLHIHHLPRVR